MRWAGHAACSMCDEKINPYKVCWENARKCMIMIILKHILLMLNVKVCALLIWLRIGTSDGLL
jgi:hypothetical protein